MRWLSVLGHFTAYGGPATDRIHDEKQGMTTVDRTSLFTGCPLFKRCQKSPLLDCLLNLCFVTPRSRGVERSLTQFIHHPKPDRIGALKENTAVLGGLLLVQGDIGILYAGFFAP